MITRCCILAVLLLGTSVARTALGNPADVTSAEPLTRFPSAIAGWSGHDEPLDAEVVKVAAVDDYLNRTYTSAGNSLGVYIGYYQSQKQGESLHSPLQCLPGAGWQPTVAEPLTLDLAQSAEGPKIRKLVAQRGVDRLLVLYWYQTMKRVTGSEYQRKLFLVADSFASGRTDVALVRIISAMNLRDQDSEARALSLARPFAERLLPEVRTRLFRE